jgi:3-oxoadipate enol-lactonase
MHVPTLVIVGDQDANYVQQRVDALASGIPGARKAVIPNTAHVPNMERPDEFTRLVFDFLAGI